MIIDKLYEKVREKGPLCVGLDTKVDYIPKFITSENNLQDSIYEFNKKIIDITKDYTAIYKPQLAYYEAMGLSGMKAYKKTMDYLRENKLLVISDVKRSDIASTAQMYAKAYFEGDFESDFITLNPYMGYDSITPYLEYVEKKEKGVFVLLRTSNEGAKDIQCQKMEDKNQLYKNVGKKLQEIASKYKGSCGYSSLGLVVGGTHKDEAEVIRKEFSDMYFLIPGYGAQGGTGEDALRYMQDGNGGVVNSSRGIIAKHTKIENITTENITKKQFEEIINQAIEKMRGDLKVVK